MAVTVAILAGAVRVDGADTEIAAQLTRLITVAQAAVERYTPAAPESVKDEAIIRMAGYLYDAPTIPEPGSNLNIAALRASGAAGLLAPYRVHRLGVSDMAAAAMAAAPAGNPVIGLSQSGGVLTVRFADGDSTTIPLPTGGGGGGGGITLAQATAAATQYVQGLTAVPQAMRSDVDARAEGVLDMEIPDERRLPALGTAGQVPAVNAGANGIEWTDAAAGAQGPAGPAGPQGPAGPKGDKGDPGTSGGATDVNTLEPLSALPAVAGRDTGEIVNVNGALYELLAAGIDRHIYHGTIGAPMGSFIGDSTFQWEEEPDNVRANFSKDALGRAPPADIYVRVTTPAGLSSESQVHRADATNDTASTYGYLRASGAPGLISTGAPVKAGLPFAVECYSDAALKTALNVIPNTARWARRDRGDVTIDTPAPTQASLYAPAKAIIRPAPGIRIAADDVASTLTIGGRMVAPAAAATLPTGGVEVGEVVRLTADETNHPADRLFAVVSDTTGLNELRLTAPDDPKTTNGWEIVVTADDAPGNANRRGKAFLIIPAAEITNRPTGVALQLDGAVRATFAVASGALSGTATWFELSGSGLPKFADFAVGTHWRANLIGGNSGTPRYETTFEAGLYERGGLQADGYNAISFGGAAAAGGLIATQLFADFWASDGSVSAASKRISGATAKPMRDWCMDSARKLGDYILFVWKQSAGDPTNMKYNMTGAAPVYGPGGAASNYYHTIIPGNIGFFFGLYVLQCEVGFSNRQPFVTISIADGAGTPLSIGLTRRFDIYGVSV